jgi:hypothetical protein
VTVMVTGTVKMDEATYYKVFKEVHDLANPPEGLIFHAVYEVDGGMSIVDFWTSAEAFQSAMTDGPIGRDLQAEGVAPPTDAKFTTLLNTFRP